MAKYTKEEVITERKCGLHRFDEAVRLSSRQEVLKKTIEFAKEYPDSDGGNWPCVSWAAGNAVMDICHPDVKTLPKNFTQSYNLDEAFTEEELNVIAQECNLIMPPKDWDPWSNSFVLPKNRKKSKKL